MSEPLFDVAEQPLRRIGFCGLQLISKTQSIDCLIKYCFNTQTGNGGAWRGQV